MYRVVVLKTPPAMRQFTRIAIIFRTSRFLFTISLTLFVFLEVALSLNGMFVSFFAHTNGQRRTLSSLRGSRGAPEVPPLCRETRSLGPQMLNATVGYHFPIDSDPNGRVALFTFLINSATNNGYCISDACCGDLAGLFCIWKWYV